MSLDDAHTRSVSDAAALMLRDRRCVVVAATSRAAAEHFSCAAGIVEPLVLTRQELVAAPRHLRSELRAAGIEVAVVHTRDWRSETAPQFYELVLTLLPVRERYLIDEAVNAISTLRRRRLALKTTALPIVVACGMASPARELARLVSTRSNGGGRPRRPLPSAHAAVMAVWPGTLGVSVGGSVTHISGILKGFRAAGLRIGLISAIPPPPQLQSVVDEIEICERLPRRARITADVGDLSVNAEVRRAGARLFRRVRPSLVYQRHAPFLVAGLDLARTAGVPFVLEWNGSESWVRQHWGTQIAVERVFTPVLRAMERRAVRDADLTVAVSDHAAAMATEAGAEADTVVVVPNAVDLDEIDRAVAAEAPKVGPRPPRIGWIGSFGPWHGAEVLVRALAVLAAKAELVMVGDGVERRRCQQLAEQLGVGSRIEWTGVLPHEEALRRLSACDILASPHIPLSDRPFFGSPTKLFEYMGLGKPIVASRLEQLGEVLEDGRTAVLVDPGDPRQFAEGVMRVLQLPDRGEALGRAARAQAAAEHTWEHRAQVILRRLDADSLSNATGPAVARNPVSPCAG